MLTKDANFLELVFSLNTDTTCLIQLLTVSEQEVIVEYSLKDNCSLFHDQNNSLILCNPKKRV